MIDEETLIKTLRKVVREEIEAVFTERFEPFKEFCLEQFEKIHDHLSVLDKKVDRLTLEMELVKADVAVLKADVAIIKSDISELKHDAKRLDRRVEKLETNNHNPQYA